MKRKELRDDEMPALARIISDAILADRIIDEEEIANYKELLGDAPDSKLVYKDKSSGREVSFKDKSLAFAVETLKSTEAKECLDRVLDRIIHSDGVCNSSEAKFQIALDYYFNHNEIHTLCGKICHKYEIKSFKLYDMLLGQNFVFYTENHKDKELNDEISRNYSIISNLLASIGFQFVYIPELAKLYSDKGKVFFNDIAMLLFPDIDTKVRNNAYKDIATMTTDRFVKEYLLKKMKFNVAGSVPSLLVMFGCSDILVSQTKFTGVRYDTYANLLRINLFRGDSVVEEVNKFVCDYNKRVTFNNVTDFNPSNTKLLYQGMFRVFFDMVALSNDKTSSLRIDIYTESRTISVCNRPLSLDATHASLFALIVWASVFGDKSGIPHYSCATDEQKAYMNEKYRKIYDNIFKSRGREVNAPVYNSLKTRLSEVLRKIKSVTDANVIETKNQYIRLQVPPENVYVDNISITKEESWSNL